MTSVPAPSVTILIPAYKAMATLEKAVTSVVTQSFRDWELLIVDDCSPDGTGLLADRLADQDSRIRVIHLPRNGGKPNAMNQGTTQARGVWIAILDADDWYDPARLEKLMEAATDDVQMLADNQYFYDFKAQDIAGTAFPADQPPRLLDMDGFLARSAPTDGFDYGMLKPVFRADFLRQNHIRYYEPARIGEDYLILLHFFAAGGKARLLPQPLYYYVQPFGTLSRQWAQEGRRPYDFELLQTVNTHGMDSLRGTLTPAQTAILQKRGAAIAALARFHQLREALAGRVITKALRLLATAPPSFWHLLAGRVWKRLRHAFHAGIRHVAG